MKLLNPNTPLSNFIYSILNEKNKQIKENILLGDINFPKILFYSKRKEENTLKAPSHIEFLNNLNRQKQLSEVREEKLNLEKKVNMVDNQLLSIKNHNKSQIKPNLNERYLNINLNNNINNTNRISSEKNSKSKNKNTKSSSSEKKSKNKNVNSLPSLGKPQIKNKKIYNIGLKPIQIKSFKSNSKINNHETEERLEKNAKAFIRKIKDNKKNLLAMINKKQEKFSLRLKNEIEKMEKQKQLQFENNIYNTNNVDYYNINNINNYSNFNNIKKEENNYSSNNSRIINNKQKKKYYHYSPYNYKNPEMLKNISNDLINFNSELYYNNNIPDIIQYQFLLAPLYQNNNMAKMGSAPLINIDDNFRINNNPEIKDMTNGEIIGNLSRINNYSYRNDESNYDINNNDNSFNKKHLYYFNEPKYEIESTYGENEIDQTKLKTKNNNY